MEETERKEEEVKDNNASSSATVNISASESNIQDEELAVTDKAIEMLRTVFDPEIPVNVYDLGLIYKIDYDKKEKELHVDMTLTAPSCPAADFILEDVRQKLVSIDGPEKVDLRLVFEPEWNQDMMSEEAKLELGFL
ncbi:MAG: metal-sulfur cluster assembly factor [Muribaculaceae bacterium]|nr:metal-sulfur cluster assembly factor [Muribaculaceae bacterium]